MSQEYLFFPVRLPGLFNPTAQEFDALRAKHASVEEFFDSSMTVYQLEVYIRKLQELFPEWSDLPALIKHLEVGKKNILRFYQTLFASSTPKQRNVARSIWKLLKNIGEDAMATDEYKNLTNFLEPYGFEKENVEYPEIEFFRPKVDEKGIFFDTNLPGVYNPTMHKFQKKMKRWSKKPSKMLSKIADKFDILTLYEVERINNVVQDVLYDKYKDTKYKVVLDTLHEFLSKKKVEIDNFLQKIRFGALTASEGYLLNRKWNRIQQLGLEEGREFNSLEDALKHLKEKGDAENKTEAIPKKATVKKTSVKKPSIKKPATEKKTPQKPSRKKGVQEEKENDEQVFIALNDKEIIPVLDRTQNLILIQDMRNVFKSFDKDLKIAKDVFDEINLRLYRWVQTICSFLPVSAWQESNETCSGTVLTVATLQNALKIAGMALPNELPAGTPMPSQGRLAKTIRFYIQPIAKMSADGLLLMSKALALHFLELVAELIRVTREKNRKIVSFCSTKSNAMNVRASTKRMEGHADEMDIFVEEITDSDDSEQSDSSDSEQSDTIW